MFGASLAKSDMEYGVIIKDEDLEMRKPLASAMSSDIMNSSQEDNQDDGNEINIESGQNTPVSVH